MLTNYLKIAFRNLWKRKLFSGINLLGLGIAIAASLLLFLTTLHEFSYDKFHDNADQIYRVYMEENLSTGVDRQANMQVPLQPAILEAFPEIAHASRWKNSGGLVQFEDNARGESFRYADEDFFKMFSFEFLQGDAETALQELNGVVLPEKSVKRLFKDQDAMGKMLTVVDGGKRMNMQVTGVIEDTPENSSLELGLIMRFENDPDYEGDKDNWNNFSHDTYVQLPDQLSQAQFEERVKDIVHTYMAEEADLIKSDGGIADAEGEYLRFRLQPLTDVHFDTLLSGSSMRKAFPIGLFVIGLFILFIACFNFVNLTLGSSLTRAKEVGVRKVLGANRRQVMAQFWGEGLIVISMALVIGLILADLILPEFNASFRQSISLNHPNVYIGLALVLLLSITIGGLYPSWALSRFQAAEVLKGSTKMQRSGRLRNVLILFQFSFSVLLISCTLIIGQQIKFLKDSPLGFNREEVISVPISGDIDGQQLIDRFRNELSAEPTILSITAAYNNIGMGKDNSAMTSKMGFAQEGKMMETHWNPVDYDYFETLEIPLLEGRSFSKEHPTDSVKAIVINETFAKQLGEGPYVGKVVDVTPEGMEIIGVVQDFHFKSLHQAIAPMTMSLGKNSDFGYNYFFVRVEGGDLGERLALLENTWKKINPGATFQASFLDENTERLYRGEQTLGNIFMVASGIAIFLSC
ncbi:MAG: ABC transporter permease, partial [Saprospiraceae bacterium]|nr:ABC transporter permease [Saprospiraceae bacterium]